MAAMREPWSSLIVNTKAKLGSGATTPPRSARLVVTLDDPCLLSVLCLERLACAFENKSFAVPHLLNRLGSIAAKDVTVANTVLEFLVNSCWHLRADFREGNTYGMFLLQSLITFCENFHQLSHLRLWRVLVLALMAVAPDLAALARLRDLNAEMQLGETVKCRMSSFDNLSPMCWPLVACGLALQACRDVQDGASLSGVELADAFVSAQALLSMSLQDDSRPCHLQMCFPFLESALKFCHLEENDEFVKAASELVTGVLAVMERAQELLDANQLEDYSDEVFERKLDPSLWVLKPDIVNGEIVTKAYTVLPRIADRMSLAVCVRVWKAAILMMPRSIFLPIMLVVLSNAVMFDWPATAADVDTNTFADLRALLDHLFMSETVSCYPVDDEELIPLLQAGGRRSFKDQMRSIQHAVRLYIVLIYKDTKGGTNYSGLLDEQMQQHVATVWLQPLLEQANSANIKKSSNREKLEDAYAVVDYALDINKDPALAKLGLPPY